MTFTRTVFAKTRKRPVYGKGDGMKRLALVLVTALAVSACGGSSSPTAPTQSAINISGTWVEAGSPLTLTISQSGNRITGTWSLTGIGGTVTGSSAGRSVTLTFNPSDPRDCQISFTGTVASGDRRIDGTAATTNCTVSFGGASTLIKQ